MNWKIIAAIILFYIAFKIFIHSAMKRRIASTKAEGYRRQREDGASGTDSSLDGSSDSSSGSSSDSGWDSGSSSDGGGGDGGGGGD